MEKVHELNFLTDAEEIEEKGKKCEVSNCREFNSAISYQKDCFFATFLHGQLNR